MAAARDEAVGVIMAFMDRPDEAAARSVERQVLRRCLAFCDARNFTSCATNPRFQKLYANTVRKACMILKHRPDLQAAFLLPEEDDAAAAAAAAGTAGTVSPLDLPRKDLFPEVWGASEQRHQTLMSQAYQTRRVAKTKQFTCPRCKHRECDFYEMQCRSADESMTLFITCLNCAHQWRIG